MLLDVSASIDATIRSPLQISIKKGRLDVVKFLIEEVKCDIVAEKTKKGDDLLSLAVNYNHPEIVLFLTTSFKSYFDRDTKSVLSGFNLTQKAVYMHHFKCADILIDLGCEI